MQKQRFTVRVRKTRLRILIGKEVNSGESILSKWKERRILKSALGDDTSLINFKERNILSQILKCTYPSH